MSEYAIVLTRSIPTETGQDISVLNVHDYKTIREVMDWVDCQCQGVTFPIRVEIVQTADL